MKLRVVITGFCLGLATIDYPENRDGKTHELRFKTSRPGIQLRASRTTYTAPSQ
jgi:hypothetical protein